MNFTVDWFSDHIPTWEEKVLPLIKGMTPSYLEIGSHEGRSLAWMLEKNPQLIATSIDPHNDGSLDNFISNMHGFGSRVTMMRAKSQDALRKLMFHFDVIYIDGSHWAHDAMSDTVLSWPLLKTGGVMIWDDYGWLVGDDPIRGPKPAIDAFLACYRTQYKVLHIGYQFIVQKIQQGGFIESMNAPAESDTFRRVSGA